MKRNFCLDIGGSFIKLGIGEGNDLEEIASAPTPSHYEAFLARTVETLLTGGLRPGDRLGISIAGSIDADNGSVHAAQLPFLAGVSFAGDLGTALAELLAEPMHDGIVVENDADCFAMAEAHFGAGRGFDNVFAVILGTGVGGAQVYRGQLLRGFGGTAGEWGHGPFIQKQDPSVPGFVPQFACACGQKGCINTIGGARGLEAMHAAAGNPLLDSRQIVDGWAGGDPACSATITAYVSVLSDALALTINITGAQIVPVGGGLSNASALLSAIDSEVRGKTLLARSKPLVIEGQTGQNGGLWGIHAQLLNEAQPA
ncbi:ROK family protein [Hoeflea sp. TYP-13]|uniref:ROK family protein n=1 Tax=Hoeflea sp. TYP-13 TaxID=3230023 RepID=UPI0034C60905